MRGYTQLTQEERYQIYALKKAGHSQAEIATLLDTRLAPAASVLIGREVIQAGKHREVEEDPPQDVTPSRSDVT